MRRSAAATLPPAGLPGLHPSWSRLVTVTGSDGQAHTWHLLDSGAEDGAVGTMLCVHGNPTWSYLWRRLLAERPAGWRIVAVDQLGMGYSERLTEPRTLAQRVDDLDALTTELTLAGPVVTVAHDWGGIISLGWALRQHARAAPETASADLSPIAVSGIVLTNTAVHQPAGSPAPALIRLARTPGARQLFCQYLPVFLRLTTRLSRPPLPAQVRAAFAAPYSRPYRRAAIADFVADIPLEDSHPSARALAAVADRLGELAELPVLLLWGARDPVFSDLYLNDVLGRFPHADVHRYQGASHLVLEDQPVGARVIADWVGKCAHRSTERLPVGEASERASVGVSVPPGRADELAVLQLQKGATPDRLTFAELEQAIDAAAGRLSQSGVRPGSRVALLIPPGIDLTVATYACWRLGALVVVADAGLGVRGMGRALRGAGPDFVLAAGRGLLAARLMRLPATVLAFDPPGGRGTGGTVAGSSLPLPAGDHDAAVVFTSGATGSAKGVLYRHSQLLAQVELLRRTYGIGPDDRLVAAFPPFALYAPALGIASVVPRMTVTAPATLTAAALADAIDAAQATLVFAAPAALRNVVATQDRLTARQRKALGGPRLVLSAGAPVPVGLQRAVAALLPNASIHTPYGMTEALPVTDVRLEDLETDAGERGVCVGRPVPGVRVAISSLDTVGRALEPPSGTPGVVGEICISAAHVKDHYDRLWATEAQSSRDAGWHRSADVGVLDGEGRLWVQGRLRDVISTADGPLTPVPLELKVEQLPQVRAAAVVGVGPVGSQHPVVVAVLDRAGAKRSRPRIMVAVRGRSRLTLAPPELAAEVRAASGCDASAVFCASQLPVDIRHNSKIDRARLAGEVTARLSGSPAAPAARRRWLGRAAGAARRRWPPR